MSLHLVAATYRTLPYYVTINHVSCFIQKINRLYCVSSIIVLGNTLFTKTNGVVVLLHICCGRSQYELYMSQGITFTISVTKMLIEFQLCIYLTSPTSTFNLQRNQILKYRKQSKQQQYRYFGSIFGILYYS